MNRAFTLIELLVVISIIALLSSVVLASIAGAREKARVATALAFERDVHNQLFDNLVAEYTFNEATSGSASGETLFDSSSNNHHATGYVDVVWSEGVIGNGAVEFDGTDDYVGASYLPEITLNGTYTFSAWIYPETCNHRAQAIFQNSFDTSDRNGMTCYLDLVRFGYYDGVGFTSKSSSAISLNTWHHVMGVNDNGALTLYIDGVEQPSPTNNHPYLHSDSGLYFGKNTNPADIPTVFDGKIDNVRIYGAAYE